MKVIIDRSKLLKAPEARKPLTSFRLTGRQPMVHGYMKYICEKCHKELTMWLELGVEDQGKNGRPHQPCPFVIVCDCGGFAQDVSGYIPLPYERPLLPNMTFFAYDDSDPENPQACGIKSIYAPKREDTE